MDVNDNPPAFNLSDPGYASTMVDETHEKFFPFQNYSVADAVRHRKRYLSSLSMVRCCVCLQDSGINAVITYSVIGGAPSNLFDAQAEVGGFHLALLQSLNHESGRNYLLTIQVMKESRLSCALTVGLSAC